MDNPPKKLYRSKKDRIIAGVCGGLAEYLKIDPLIIRLVFVAVALADGIGILIYIIMWIIVPEDSSAGADVEPDKTVLSAGQTWLKDRRNLLAMIIIVIGVVLLLKQLMPLNWSLAHYFWPVAIIIVGVYLIAKK